MTPSPPDSLRPKLIFHRAARLRCPVCGGRPVFLSWFTLSSSCPVCGFHLDRDEPGYWIGSYTVNLFATEGVFALFFVLGMVVTWPEVPWRGLLYGGVALAVITPPLILPYTKMLYLAIDLCFRPPEPEDLATPIERGFLTPRRPVDSGRHAGG